MIKIIFCLQRLSQLTAAEFSCYWRETHAPLVRKHQAILRIVRYVQFHATADEVNERLRNFRSSPEPYDGVAEIWHESRESFLAIAHNPDARAASRELREDETRFVDLSRSPIFVGLEHPVIT